MATKLNMEKLILLLGLFVCALNLNAYPTHWWAKVAENQRKGSWEVLPHEAAQGELVLSKRNELGVFSNLAPSEFVFQGETYASIEALWQMMKYPDPNSAKDPRNSLASSYPYTREQVKKMSGFPSKKAGDAANKVNKEHGFKNISYRSYFFDYKDMEEGSQFHYQIISSAIKAKVYQNPEILKLLMSTKGLKLVPDHKIGTNKPASYFYNQILMKIRDGQQL